MRNQMIYNVLIHSKIYAYSEVEVEAATEDQARELALELIDDPISSPEMWELEVKTFDVTDIIESDSNKSRVLHSIMDEDDDE